MPWVGTPKTWTADEFVETAEMNAEVRDRFLSLNSMPAAHVTHSANQIITSGVLTALAFDTERFDTDTIHDPATSSRLTCKTAGKYLIGAAIEWEGAAAGTFRQATIRGNGTNVIADDTRTQPGGGLCRQVVVILASLAVNDYVEVVVGHDRGSGLSVTKAANYSPEFWMQRTSD